MLRSPGVWGGERFCVLLAGVGTSCFSETPLMQFVPYDAAVLETMATTRPMHANFDIGILNWRGSERFPLTNWDACVMLGSGKVKQTAFIRTLYGALICRGT